MSLHTLTPEQEGGLILGLPTLFLLLFWLTSTYLRVWRFPVRTRHATVVHKRMATSFVQGGGAHACFVTFRFDEGDEEELGLFSEDYAALHEGQTGSLRTRGTRVLGFTVD